MMARNAFVLVIGFLSVAWARVPLEAQAAEQADVPCRDVPCVVTVDWTREGGPANQVPDRRYGNAAQLEGAIKASLAQRGFANHSGTGSQDLKILLIPDVGNAMCDEMAGTSTDRSCRAVLQIQARLEGPDELRDRVDLPSRIRNQCSSDKVMPVDRLGVFVADWIIYAVEGRAKGERRPVARC